MCASAFAAEGMKASNESQNSISVTANLTATTINFTISDRVSARTNTETDDIFDLTYSDFEVTNRMKIGVLEVVSLKAEGENGWTVVNDDAVTWTNMLRDQHKLSMLATNDNSTNDALKTNGINLAGNGITEDYKVELQNNGGTTTYKLTGHTGPVSAPMTETTVAKLIVTVAIK